MVASRQRDLGPHFPEKSWNASTLRRYAVQSNSAGDPRNHYPRVPQLFTPVSCLAHLAKSWVATAAVSYTAVHPAATVRQQDGQDANMVGMHMAPSSLTSASWNAESI